MSTTIKEMKMLRDVLITLASNTTETQQSLMQITAATEAQETTTTNCSLSKSIKSLSEQIDLVKSLVVFYDKKIREENGKARIARHMENAKNLTASFRAIQSEEKQRDSKTLARRQTIGGTSSILKSVSSTLTVANEESRGRVSRDGGDDINARVNAKISCILIERGEDRETLESYLRATPTLTTSVTGTSIPHSSPPSSGFVRIPRTDREISARTESVRGSTAPVNCSDDDETVFGDALDIVKSVKNQQRPRPVRRSTMPVQRKSSESAPHPIQELSVQPILERSDVRREDANSAFCGPIFSKNEQRTSNRRNQRSGICK
jgi:hypothetical protein